MVGKCTFKDGRPVSSDTRRTESPESWGLIAETSGTTCQTYWVLWWCREGTSTWVARCCDRSTKMDKFTRPADRGNGWLSVKGISKDQYRRLRGTKPWWGYLGWCEGAHSHCFSRRRWSRASKDQHREPASTAIPGQSWVWPEIYDSCTEGLHARRTTSGSGNGAPGEGLYQWPSRPGSTHPSPLS